MKEPITVRGIAASPGIALGYVHLLDRGKMAVVRRKVPSAGVEPEVRRFEEALESSRDQLRELRRKVSEEQGADHVYLIEAQLLMLDDPSLKDAARAIIEGQQINAEWAVQKALERFKAMFDRIDDEYFRDRRSDIEYVEERLLRALAGKRDQEYLSLQKKTVIVAHDLSPVDLVRMNREHLSAFATDIGGRTSHTAIIARSLGLPMVVGLNEVTQHTRNGDRIIVDGAEGYVHLNPDSAVWSGYEEKRDRFLKARKELLRNRNFKAETKDHFEIQLRANLDFAEEVPEIEANGAESVGMLRTEHLFLEGPIPVTEEEQLAGYKRIVEALKPREVVIRALDFAGDKLFAHPSGMDVTMSPALGLRGIRFLLAEKDLFRSQLTAILRASQFGKVAVLYPMVTTVSEVRECNRIMEEIHVELLEARIPVDPDIRAGVLIEIPAAALSVDEIAREVDFLAVGTNDLAQYTFAADRKNPLVSNLYDPIHPAFLELLHGIARKSHQAGIEVGVCGEMASDPLSIPALLGMEFNYLSMTPGSIPLVKEIVRELSLEQCREWLRILRTEAETGRARYVEEFTAWYRERFQDFSS